MYLLESNQSATAKFDSALVALGDAMEEPRDVAASFSAYNLRGGNGVSLRDIALNSGDDLLFEAYWGAKNYSDEFVSSAIAGTGSFAGWDDGSLGKLATKAAVYSGVLRHSLGVLVEGVRLCVARERGVAADLWDVAWAYMTGSLEGAEGTGEGVSVYALGEHRCPQFDTCRADTSLARANDKARTLWEIGHEALHHGDCKMAYDALAPIEAQLTVPLVQGALRKVYQIDAAGEGGDVIEIAEGWAFAFALLPLVHRCNASAAVTIRANMFLNADPIVPDGWRAVKAVFESVYECLGISCADVGAMVTCGEDGGMACWEACDDSASDDDDDNDDDDKDEDDEGDDDDDDGFTPAVFYGVLAAGTVLFIILLVAGIILLVAMCSESSRSCDPVAGTSSRSDPRARVELIEKCQGLTV